MQLKLKFWRLEVIFFLNLHILQIFGLFLTKNDEISLITKTNHWKINEIFRLLSVIVGCIIRLSKFLDGDLTII